MKQLPFIIRIPPSIIKDTKKRINEKKFLFEVYCRNENNSFTFHNFQFLKSKLNSPIEKCKHQKHKYYGWFF